MTPPVKWRAKVQNVVGCHCNWGCPRAFDAPPTVGHCEGIIGHCVVTGKYGDTSLDGLKWVLIVRWPGSDSREARPRDRIPGRAGAGSEARRARSDRHRASSIGGLTMDHRGKSAHAYVTDWKGP